MSDIKIDKGTLSPQDYENTKLITLPDGSQEEVYISRAGNVVMHPKDRYKTCIDSERRQLCWDLYIKSLKTDKPSARQAALDAGFSPNTAINIRSMAWFKENMKTLRKSAMYSKAQRNIARILDLDYSKMKILEDGSEEESIDKDVLRVVADISKTVVTHLGKDDGWSTKTEVAGKMDSEIKINSISYADPIQIENQAVDDTIKQIEEVIIKEVETKNGNNPAASL